jgi:hypothetical protein
MKKKEKGILNFLNSLLILKERVKVPLKEIYLILMGQYRKKMSLIDYFLY